ncbi:MAG: ABC transporter permease [Bacillota bacterium]|nr:ABC transporter permease [Bacillota bacterium]
MLSFIISSLLQGFIFAMVALGVYITFRILDFPDMSVDGTFPLGASVAALCLTKGINPGLACLLSFAAGSLGGLATAILHVKLKISNLLSGILVMIGLYSVNLRIMGKSNIPLFNYKTIFNADINPVIVVAVFALCTKVILDLFLKTKLGFILNAVGDNEQLVTSLGVNKDFVKTVGLMLSNAIAALAGAIMAQSQGFADVGMGTGTVVIGLAAVILGESVFKKFNKIKNTTMVVIGAVLYKLAIAAALRAGLNPNDLKLVTALIVIAVLAANNFEIKGLRNSHKAVKGGVVIASSTKSS